MRTPNQIAASRANGAKSKGPITPQGKHNSSRNATRHGLLAATIVLEAELTGRFLELLDSLIEEHQPQTPTETMLVDTIAAARWRQDRIWGMQKVAFDHDIASCDAGTESSPLRAVLALRGSPDGVRTHELLLRYEVALDRQISRSLLRLQQLQERRSKAPMPPSSVLRGPHAGAGVSHGQRGSAPAERTQQPIETAIQRAPVAVPTPPRPVPKNETALSMTPSASPLPKNETGLPSATRGKFRWARKK